MEILILLSDILSAGKIPDLIPFSDYLERPWDWFLSLSLFTKIIVVVFGSLGFYLILRLFYITVESILSIFQ